jgi:hypothetical protein
MLQMAIEQDIIEDPNNRLAEFIADRNRTRRNPVTISIIEKTFFREFILTPPTVPMLRDVIAQVLQLYDAADRDKVLFRQVTDQQWSVIEGRIDRLFVHKIWDDTSPEVVERLKINAVEKVRNFMTGHGLTVNWVLGGAGA